MASINDRSRCSGHSSCRFAGASALVAAGMFLLGGFSPAQAAVVCDVLWTFNNTTNDATANGNNGTASGTTSYNAAATFGGVTQQSILIGSGGGVTNAAAASLPLATTASWSENLWLNLSSTPASLNYLAGFGNYTNSGAATTSRGYIQFGGSSSNDFYFWGQGNVDSGMNYNTSSTWNMYTITYDGTDIRMYLNGTLEKTAAVTFSGTAPADLHVGNPGPWNSTFTASEADFSVWTGALSATQINYLASNGTATSVPLPPTLTWTGTASQNWNASAVNWTSAGTATTYSDGSSVLFDESVGSAGSTIVAINAANVNPNAVTFNNTTHNYTLTGPYGISGGATLTMSGSGLVTITNSNAYTGATKLTAGTLQLGNGASGNDGSLNGTSGVTVTNAALAYNLAGSQTVSYPITGTNCTLIMAGTGQVTFNNTGAVGFGSNGSTLAVNAGTVKYTGLANDTGLYQTSININSGATLQMSPASGVENYFGAWNSTYTGGGTLNLAGSGGALYLSGYGAGDRYVDFSPGALIFVSTGTFYGGAVSIWTSNSAALTVANGATFNPYGANVQFDALNGAGTVNQSTAAAVTLTVGVAGGSGNFAGVIENTSGVLGFTMTGPGIQILSGANTYTGATTVSGGTLQLGTGQNGQDGSINNTSGVTNNAAMVYNLYGNQTAPYSISGSGNLTKLGQGRLYLAGNNSYTGTTAVSAGALYITGANATTGISVAGGATLGGTGSVTSASANVANGGTLDFSQNAGNTFSLAGVTFAGHATINVDALANYTNSPVLSAGALVTAGSIGINANLGSASVLSGTYDLISYSSIGGAGTSAFTLASVSGLGNRQTAALVDVSNMIEVAVSGYTPYWSGNQADWKAANAWTLQPGNTPTTFQTGDTDIFDDSANGSTYGGVVALNAGNVAPATVSFNNNALAYTVSGSYGITGTGSLSVNGGGTVTILNSNSYTGGTTLNNGLLSFGNGALGSTGSITFAGNSILQWNGSNTQDVSSRLIINNGMTATIDTQGNNVTFASGFGGGLSGSLNYIGGGILTLAGSNTYTGMTTISNGTLQLGTGAAGQDGSINGAGGVTVNSTLAYNLAGSQTASYAIGGNGSLVKLGPGILTLAGTNSFSGGTTLSGGTLVNANNLALGGYAAPVTLSGGNNNLELRFTTGVQSNIQATTYMPITVLSGGSGSTTLTFNEGTSFVNASLNIGQAVTLQTTGTGTQDGLLGQITGNGAGPGSDSVIFSAPPGATFYYTAGYSGYGIAANSFLGNVHFTGSGNIVTQNLAYISSALVNGAIPNTASVTVDAGTTWTLNWGNQSIDGLNGGGSIVTNANTINTLTVGANNGSGTFSGAIKGTGGLALGGSGVETLTGSNTYTGATTINEGTLQLGTGQSGQDGSINATSGVANYSVLAYNLAGNQTVRYLISGNGTLAKQGPGTLALTAANTYSGATVISGGVLNAATLANEGNPSAIGQGSGVPAAGDLVIDGGTLQYTGPAAANSNWLFTVGPSGNAALDASGGPTGAMTLGSNGGAIAFANSAAAATLTLTGSGAGNLGATIGDSGVSPNVTSLVKTGTGSWTLTGANTYSGPTTITSGGLYLDAANATTSISVAGGATLGGTGSTTAGANVANGGTLDFSQNAGNTFSLAGSLTFAGHATINVDALANYTAGTAGPVLSAGRLVPSSTAGLITIDANLGSTTVLSGTYDLINYSGAIGGAGLAAFAPPVVSGIASRQAALLVAVSNQIDLVVTGGSPYWSGNQPDWLSTHAWTLQPGNTPITFQAGDSDIFDDSATGEYGGNVALNSGNVAPGAVFFNNNSLSYTVSGSYGITGSTSLAVQGGGTVTIANSNSYTGGTIVTNNSTLNANAANALGSGQLSVSSGIVNVGYPQSISSVVLGGGLLNLASTSATLGSGTLAFGGGATLDNTSGAPLALAGNNPQIWAGSFTFQGSNPLNLGTGAVTINASPSVTVNASTLTVGGAISGSGALTVNGGGALVLTGSSTYSGSTTISGGTLQLGTGLAGQDGSINGTSGVTDNTVLAFNLAGNQTAAYAIGGYGSLALNSGKLTLTGTNSYSGGSNVNGGTLQIGDGLTTNGAFGTGQYNLATGAELYLNYATAVPSSNGWSSNISGSGTVVLNSAQAVNGSANWGPNSATATVFYPSFTGTLQIDNGRIDISPAGLGGVSNIIVNGGIVSSGQFLAWSGVYDVPITIAGNGWGETGEPGALRAAGGAVTTWAGPITLTANAGISAQDATSFTLTGPITGNYQVEFETATGFPGTINLVPSGTSQNSYGSTQVDKGATVIAGNQYAFSTGGLLMNGGVLELDGFNASFANLSGTSGTIGNYGGAAATITVGADNSSTAYGASLVDGNGGAALALEKIGSGELVLSPGAPGNTYSGGTNVEAGTLILASATALADGSSLTVGQGASSLFAPAYAGPVTSAAGQVAAVPEPGTLVLLLAAALWSVVACYRFSRRKMN